MSPNTPKHARGRPDSVALRQGAETQPAADAGSGSPPRPRSLPSRANANGVPFNRGSHLFWSIYRAPSFSDAPIESLKPRWCGGGGNGRIRSAGVSTLRVKIGGSPKGPRPVVGPQCRGSEYHSRGTCSPHNCGPESRAGPGLITLGSYNLLLHWRTPVQGSSPVWFPSSSSVKKRAV